VSQFSKEDTVRILNNLDIMSAGHIPPERRAWAHMFIALGLLQQVAPSAEVFTRERWLRFAGIIYDNVYGALSSEKGPQA
jgi:hypothetical protein